MFPNRSKMANERIYMKSYELIPSWQVNCIGNVTDIITKKIGE